MSVRTQQISIKDSFPLVKKSKDPFAPIKEAITNSFDAIKGRLDSGVAFTPAIKVSLHFHKHKDLAQQESIDLNFVEIEDNGIGFLKDWFARYKNLSQSTKKMNNRGIGKIQMFHRFERVSLDSIFVENNYWKQLKDDWSITGESSDNQPVNVAEQKDTKTIVKLEKFYGNDKEKKFYFRYFSDMNNLKRDILKEFLLRLNQTSLVHRLTLAISVFLDKEQKSTFTFDEKTIPQPDKEETATINTEKMVIKNGKDIEWQIVLDKQHTLTIRRFAMDSALMDENGIYMCSKDILVEEVNYPLVNKKSDYQGSRYLT